MKNLIKTCVISLGMVGAADQSALALEQIRVIDMWTCAHWAERVRDNHPIEDHLVGLINGMSMASGLNLWDVPTKIEKGQLFYWMDQYCAKNPLEILLQGAAAFAIERRGAEWRDKFKQ
jgi:hypothetical protein